MRLVRLVAALVLLLVVPIQVEAKPPVVDNCGMNPTDWYPSPKGDPCGKHKDVASCRTDQRCKGMPYRGESVVACEDDGSGFSKNCPTVGCIAR